MKTRILLLLPLVFSCEIMQEDIDLTQEPQTLLPIPTTSVQAVWERVQQSELGFVEFFLRRRQFVGSGLCYLFRRRGEFLQRAFCARPPFSTQAALKIRMDRTSLVDHYPVGSRLLILLNGLGAGMNNNQLTLGSYQGNSIATIPEYRLKEHFYRSDSFTA